MLTAFRPLRPQLFTITCCTLLLLAATAARAQKLNSKRPTVYITFKDFIDKTKDANPSQAARLLLHNNSRWPIHYETHYDPAVARGQIIYVMESTDGSRDYGTYGDTVMGGTVMPGKTLEFVVPRGHFLKDGGIYVEFNFAWELRRGDTVQNETIHRVRFLSNDLPPWPK